MDYPNMSYCMCENTLEAMRQVINAMLESEDFIHNMSTEEKWAFSKLYNACKEFINLTDEIIENCETDLSDLCYD